MGFSEAEFEMALMECKKCHSVVRPYEYCTEDGCPQRKPDIEPEADRAARHKQAITKALEAVVVQCEAARRDGFYVEFGVGLNQFGQYVIHPAVGLLKRF